MLIEMVWVIIRPEQGGWITLGELCLYLWHVRLLWLDCRTTCNRHGPIVVAIVASICDSALESESGECIDRILDRVVDTPLGHVIRRRAIGDDVIDRVSIQVERIVGMAIRITFVLV